MDTMDTSGVIPRVTPTVAMADVVSNMAVSTGIPSAADSTSVDRMIRIRYIIKIQEAVRVIPSSSRLLKHSTFFF